MATAGRDRIGILPGVVALTGGPGGGKSSLLTEVAKRPELARRIATTEEAIHGMRFIRMNPETVEFQCALVAIQAATEVNLARALADTDKRLILSHRGTLDPCAFWQSFGNSRESFFEMTRTTLEEHYRRYDLVVHMESAAIRVPQAYARWPDAHRPEDTKEAARLDQLLGALWGHHPRYVLIEGASDMGDKLSRALSVIQDQLQSMT